MLSRARAVITVGAAAAPTVMTSSREHGSEAAVFPRKINSVRNNPAGFGAKTPRGLCNPSSIFVPFAHTLASDPIMYLRLPKGCQKIRF
jgi:hypothetical protein